MKKIEILSIIIVILVTISCISTFIYNGFRLYAIHVSTSNEKELLVIPSQPYFGNNISNEEIHEIKNNDPILIPLEPEVVVEPSKPSYYIRINVVCNTITVYAQDENKNYSIPIKAFVCSTGTATPHSGIYATPQKFEWVDLFGSVYGQYSTQIVGHILFHSVPYRRKYDKGSLIYSYYDRLGTSASAGCVRLTVEDAKWIYDNCELGTNVEFYDDANNPGPLGKPSAQKISNNTAFRNWDPTDPDENNPWNT